ncbi:energy coupling factor transporter S component ThiW [Saliterribacillus persicus]|uniref:Energy coupling factor transporter S component ThiW n=1 Tax=Saliterribacillus persicus TaxID=930114 RepID=A0A368X8S1_9BACI|nr:energy coupling factor transporter S component ThiW [Saliterribacillus persicus]RCW64245.1 energy coupling factor transporter S component ThiW [Saliterribacillus persicus]
MNRTTLLTTMALFVAIGTLAAQFLWFPTGIAKAYPVQHAVNVMAAVILGPGPAVVIALMIGLLRNLLGLGTLLAFPGGLIGAFFAGYLYKLTKKTWSAGVGEIIGTGIIASLLSVPFANVLMGQSVGALAFVPGFLISSISGAIIGLFVLSRVKESNFIKRHAFSK